MVPLSCCIEGDNRQEVTGLFQSLLLVDCFLVGLSLTITLHPPALRSFNTSLMAPPLSLSRSLVPSVTGSSGLVEIVESSEVFHVNGYDQDSEAVALLYNPYDCDQGWWF
jgi:hypothetical protein